MQTYLFLVFSLCDEPGLDALPGLHEGLTLRDLAGVVGQHARQVRAQKQHRVSTQLCKTKSISLERIFSLTLPVLGGGGVDSTNISPSF